MVTGRELPDLARCFSRLDLFDRVIAENDALLYNPSARKERPLAPAPPKRFVEALRAKKVHPHSVGRSIVATWEPNEAPVLETIRELDLEPPKASITASMSSATPAPRAPRVTRGQRPEAPTIS
jgi:hydroxymethylpyrimidine pyrophosphatase-like HAD family hydrolase